MGQAFLPRQSAKYPGTSRTPPSVRADDLSGRLRTAFHHSGSRLLVSLPTFPKDRVSVRYFQYSPGQESCAPGYSNFTLARAT